MEDATSILVDLSQYELNGLCDGYELRRHKYEDRANAGAHEARKDWIQNIGPLSQFGVCNPINGNLIATLFPLSIPERVHALAYIVEYMFLHDDVIEETPANCPDSSLWRRNALEGHKRFQAKILMQLTTIDAPCGQRVKAAWKDSINTTVRDKDTSFNTLQEYLDFRIVDAGTPVSEALMLWGMSLLLSPDEDALLAPIKYLYFAALSLTNDYYSFDTEFAAMQDSGAAKITNAVWLHMQWHGVDVPSAKDMVRKAIIQHEREFLAASEGFRKVHAPLDERMERYLVALKYQISGNVVWHMNCPRHHPAFRYDGNAGIENEITRKYRADFTNGEVV